MTEKERWLYLMRVALDAISRANDSPRTTYAEKQLALALKKLNELMLMCADRAERKEWFRR